MNIVYKHGGRVVYKNGGRIVYKHGGHIVRRTWISWKQYNAVNIIPELRDLSYESRLIECDLTILETRRLRGDKIEMQKIVNDYEDIDRNMFFKLEKAVEPEDTDQVVWILESTLSHRRL